MCEWTPVTKKQPTYNRKYLVTISSEKTPYVTEMEYIDGYWNCHMKGDGFIDTQFDMTENVTAWMDIPEPYETNLQHYNRVTMPFIDKEFVGKKANTLCQLKGLPKMYCESVFTTCAECKEWWESPYKESEEE